MATVREFMVKLGVEVDDKALDALLKKLEALREEASRLAKTLKNTEGELDDLEKGADGAGDALKDLGDYADNAGDGVDKLGKKVGKTGKNTKGLEESMQKIRQGSVHVYHGLKMAAGAATIAATAIAAATVAMVVHTKRTAEYAEMVDRSSRAFQMSAENYQKLDFAFTAMGASTDDLNDALGTLTDRAVDAMEGTKTYIDEFKRLGVSVDSLRGKKPFEMFMMMADAAQKAGDKTQVVAAMVRIFGDDLGRRMMPAFMSSTEGFERYFNIAEKTGAIMSGDMIKGLVALQIEFRLLFGLLKGLGNLFAAELAPLLTQVVAKFVDFLSTMFHTQRMGKAVKFVTQLISEQFAALVMDIELLYLALGGPQGLVRVFKLLVAGAAAATVGIIAFSTALAVKGVALMAPYIAGVGLLALKFIIIAAVVLGFLLVLEDLWAFMTGKKSIVGMLVKDSKPFEAFTAMFFKFVDVVKGIAIKAGQELWRLWTRIGGAFGLAGEETDGWATVFRILYGIAIFTLDGILFFIFAVIQQFRVVIAVVETVIDVFVLIYDFIVGLGKTIEDFFFNLFTEGIGAAFDSLIDNMSDGFLRVFNDAAKALGRFLTIWDDGVDGLDATFEAGADVGLGNKSIQEATGAKALTPLSKTGLSDGPTTQISNEKTQIENVYVTSNGTNPQEQANALQGGISKAKKAFNSKKSGRK